MTKVSEKSRLSGLTSVFTMFGAAIDVARAIDAHKMPSPRALKTLGIDENDFRKTHILSAYRKHTAWPPLIGRQAVAAPQRAATWLR